MTFRTVPFVFHDGQLADFTIGPRREVSITVDLDPVWNPNQKRTVLVRFGAIRNMEVVQSFLERIVRPERADRYLDEVQDLEYDKDRKDVIHLHLTKNGSVEIETSNVTFV